jgi:hypothetical protein
MLGTWKVLRFLGILTIWVLGHSDWNLGSKKLEVVGAWNLEGAKVFGTFKSFGV